MLNTAAGRFGVEFLPRWRLARLPFASHLQRLFAKYEIDSVLDVGANRGQYRDFLRNEVGFTGMIISFEPVRHVFEQLERRTQEDPSWKAINMALGSTDGRWP